MANTRQGYGGQEKEPLVEDEPTPPAAEDDWGLDQGEVDEALAKLQGDSDRQA